MTDANLLARIDRLEAVEAIRQLPARYALALDMRDMDAMVGLFPADVRVGKASRGRVALRAYFDETMRVQFTGTAHHIGGHVIEFDDPDHARGAVYSRNEHETGGEWIVMQMVYLDDYQRQDGHWYFERRLPLYWYAADLNRPPVGPLKMRWPGRKPYEGGFHTAFPSWDAFWARSGGLDGPVPEPAPFDGFLKRMRGGAAAPKVRVR